LFAKKQDSELRGTRLYGDLTWCGVHFSARQSNNRLSAPVSARSCCQRVSTQNPRLCQRENIIQCLKRCAGCGLTPL
jgi:hypothetical protein